MCHKCFTYVVIKHTYNSCVSYLNMRDFSAHVKHYFQNMLRMCIKPIYTYTPVTYVTFSICYTCIHALFMCAF